MSSVYSSYVSPLDELVFDSITESNKPTDMETEADLALWTNAQFTYDNKPGHGILDNTKYPITSPTPSSTTSLISSPSSVTYENLANYLDYELPLQQHQKNQLVLQQQQQQQLQQQQQKIAHILQQQQQLIQAASATRAPNQPLLLPKIAPEMTLEEITKALLTTTTPYTIPTLSASTVLQKPTVESTEQSSTDKAPAEEDKRRRNTAASARFRIKKKMREQSMEKTVREMTEKSSGLESRVRELELEIKWLRGLLIEKGTPSEITDNKTETNTTASIKEEL